MSSDIIKKPHAKVQFDDEKVMELMNCVNDPFYFLERMKIQHPIKGAIPFEAFPFQNRMIEGYWKNRFCIALTARQMGKCVDQDTSINVDGEATKISDLIHMTRKQRIVAGLERAMVKLARNV